MSYQSKVKNNAINNIEISNEFIVICKNPDNSIGVHSVVNEDTVFLTEGIKMILDKSIIFLYALVSNLNTGEIQ